MYFQGFWDVPASYKIIDKNPALIQQNEIKLMYIFLMGLQLIER